MKLAVAMIGVLMCASLVGAEDKPDATYRVYPCGQVDKLVWKELNPNEDRPTLTGISRYNSIGPLSVTY